MGAFTDGIRQFRVRVEARATEDFRKVALELDRRVVDRTAVDEIGGGRTSGNWHPSIGPAPENVTTGGNGQGDALAALAAVIANAKLGDTIWISNNHPAAMVLEYGEYPNPAKRGTYVRSGQSRRGVQGPAWVIRTAGGYSLQSPRGMVMVTAVEFGPIVHEVRSA